MTELFFNFFKQVEYRLGAGGIFLISAGAIVLMFIVQTLICSLCSGYGFRRRACYLLYVGGICVLEYAIESKMQSEGFVILTLGLGLVLCSVLMLLPKRVVKANSEQIELARFLDRLATAPVNSVNRSRTFNGNIYTEQESKTKTSDDEVDFSHVKSVLSRLSYYSLTPSDKKQVNELECALNEAESGAISPIVKSRINDGLGALLKIMSKYGI